ncbi:Crp/Fnr family transcriptional regulator [Mesorhizobium waimense]|uniref:Crp/Fnr family transcriptional regulator n=1 Tax=Mesorhizobium waimense TaxID=1300307 RepID=UPI0026A1C1E5
MDQAISKDKSDLLRRMSPDDFALLAPHLHNRFLDLRESVESAGEPIKSVCFFESGLASVVASNRPGLDTEVGIIGREGMSGSALVMGADWAPNDCYIQMTSEAVCMEAAPFNAALQASPTLRAFLLRYVHYLHIQTRSTALSNARAKLEDRLARWLLMCDDRTTGDQIRITHEFLAIMLGVRRPGVTIGLQMLEGRGLIRSRRGEITIRDRDGLISVAEGFYGQAEADYDRLLG